VHYKRMRNAFRAGFLQNGLGALAVTDQLIPFDRHPKACVARTVQLKPLPFALAGIECRRGAELVCHGYDQVLLFAKGTGSRGRRTPDSYTTSNCLVMA